MKCKRCNEEMVLEEYYTEFIDNDDTICLREQFGCVKCNTTAIKRSYYVKDYEEEDYGN